MPTLLPIAIGAPTRQLGCTQVLAQVRDRGLSPHPGLLKLLRQYEQEEIRWAQLGAQLQVRTKHLAMQLEAQHVTRMSRGVSGY
jgi:hypothetical protein